MMRAIWTNQSISSNFNHIQRNLSAFVCLKTFTMVLVVIACLVITTGACGAQQNTETFRITSPIQPLTQSYFGGNITSGSETDPYKSGLLTRDQVQHLLHDHSNEGIDPTRTTFIHVLRWDTPDHTKIMFQKWYLYDPTRSNRYFYLQSEQQVLQRTAIPGQQDFQFIYIHFNNDLSVAGEWRNTNYENDPSKGILAHPVSYTITVTKQQTQFVQDLRTLLPLVVPEAGLLPSAVSPEIGYFSVATFHSQWHTSTIQITATTDTAQQTAQGSSSKDATPTPAISNTYHNERPSWIGLSAGIPVTSYKDVTYDQSSGTLQPKSITKQSAYVFLDGYLPPVLPSLTTLRWLPHPFYGLPMTGEVFRHQMFGLGVSLGWIEPFWGVIRDTQNKEIVGINKTNVTWKGSFGIKISISALSKAVKK